MNSSNDILPPSSGVLALDAALAGFPAGAHYTRLASTALLIVLSVGSGLLAAEAVNTEDAADGTKIAQQFGITTLPTFLLLTPEGTIAGTIRGYFPANEFVRALNDTENGYNAFVKQVKEEPAITMDYKKRLELATAFRSRYALTESETRFKKLTTESGVPANVRDSAYYELALTQVLEKHFDESLKTIRKFATVQTKGEAYEKSRLLAGDIYVQQGNYKSALSEFRSFKANFPKSQYIANVDVVLPQLEQRVKQ